MTSDRPAPDGVLVTENPTFLLATRVAVGCPVAGASPTGNQPLAVVDLIVATWDVVQECLDGADPVSHPRAAKIQFFAEPDILPSLIESLQATYRKAQELR